ncbi:MAG TPA: F0F1 ATP synthase subunit B [Chthoniobacterales bacterium]|jgi:F-type H+-transporting ATPase subunit b
MHDPLTDLMIQFGVNLPKLLAQIILFLILYFALAKFAFGPIIKILEERRRLIEEGQVNAEKIKQQLADAQKHYEEVLHKANLEAQHLIEEARKSGDALTEKKTQEAIREAEAILVRARQSIEVERNQMTSEVKAQLVDLVVNTTTKVTGKVLTPEDQKRLNAETTAQLAA